MWFAPRCGVGLNALLGLRLRPHSELIAAGLCEMEPTTARESKDRLNHLATCCLDLAERSLKVVAVKDNERAPSLGASRQVRPEEATIQSLVRERDVVRTVILERPAECLAEEALGCFQVSRRVLDVVDLLVPRHSCS